MIFFAFAGMTLVMTAEDAQEEDVFVDEDETEAYHHAMMEFEMFKEYFDDETGLTLGEWVGVEIMPVDLDELLDSVTEDPLVNASKALDSFFNDNYLLLDQLHTIDTVSDISDLVRLYWRDDYMPHTLYRHTTQRLEYVDYHDVYKETKDWSRVKSKWKEISIEENQKKYRNSMLMASVFDQGLHGFREYDFCSFHYYDYIEIFDLLNNISEISYIDDLDEWNEYIESLKREGEWGRFHMPESIEDSQDYSLLDDDSIIADLQDIIHCMENGFIPNLSNKDFDEDFFDNHLVWNDPYMSMKFPYMDNIFFNNINISYINISYSPVLSILHCVDDTKKQQVLRTYYDGEF